MKKILVTLIFVLFSVKSIAQDEYKGKVVKVLEDNVILIKDKKNKLHKVYLAGVKTPSIKQLFYKETNEFLSKEYLNLEVLVRVNSREGNKIYAWLMYGDNKSVYEDLIANGLAWINEKQLRNGFVDQIQFYAKDEKKGIWSLEDKNNPALNDFK